MQIIIRIKPELKIIRIKKIKNRVSKLKFLWKLPFSLVARISIIFFVINYSNKKFNRLFE